MTGHVFQALASLARLTADELTLKHGFLTSRPEPTLPLSGWVYLWTFTLPTGTASLTELQAAWLSFMHHRARDIPQFRGLRVFEPSPTMRWHVHAVVVKRCDVTTIRKHALKCGFGRINAKRIPASKATYILKYLSKSRWLGEGGARLVACFGFKGMPLRKMRRVDDYLRWVLDETPFMQPGGGRFFPWHQREEAAWKVWRSRLNSGTLPPPTMTKLSLQKHIDQAIGLLNAGNVVVLAEWRGAKVLAGEFSDEDNPNVKVHRVSIVHSLEVSKTASGAEMEQLQVREYLPDGTDEKSIKFTMQAGDKVIAVLKSYAWVKGVRRASLERFELLSALKGV